MTQRECPWCGPDQACISCRAKAGRAKIVEVTPKPVVVVLDPPAEFEQPLGRVEAAALRELEAVDRAETTAGQAGLALAARMDNPATTGAAMASIARQLEATMRTAMAGAEVAETSLDRMRARKSAKRGA